MTFAQNRIAELERELAQARRRHGIAVSHSITQETRATLAEASRDAMSKRPAEIYEICASDDSTSAPQDALFRIATLATPPAAEEPTR